MRQKPKSEQEKVQAAFSYHKDGQLAPESHGGP